MPLVPAASRCASTPRSPWTTQGGHVAVAAVLAQRGRGLPGLGQTVRTEIGRHDRPQIAVGPRQHPAGGVTGRHRPAQQGQRFGQRGARLDPAQLGQRSGGGPGPHGAQRLGRHGIPTGRDGPSDHVGVEVGEGSGDRSRTDGTERCGPGWRSSRARIPSGRRHAARRGSPGRSR